MDQSPAEASRQFEINNDVFVLQISENSTRFKWKKLAPFPFKKKIGNIVYNNYGKFFCFINENNNRELPQLLVYDIRKIFPQFDMYHEHFQKLASSMDKIDGRDIRNMSSNSVVEQP